VRTNARTRKGEKKMPSKLRWVFVLIPVVILLAGCFPAALSQEDAIATQVEGTLRAHAVETSVAATVAAQSGGDSGGQPLGGGEAESQPTETPTSTLAEPPTPTPTSTLGSPMVFVTVPTNCRSGPGLENYKKLGGLLVDETTEVVGLPETEMEFAIVNNPDNVGVCWLYLGYANFSYGYLKANYPNLQMYAIPDPDPGSISGIVWNDHCSQYGGSPPLGCKDTVPYTANGVIDAGEAGFAGVLVELGVGACPSTGDDSTLTNASGGYVFDDLLPGDYCVSIDALNATNSVILIPGGWSYPNANARQNITVGPGESVTNVHFGWDFQLD
jgi:hypothetical protein